MAEPQKQLKRGLTNKKNMSIEFIFNASIGSFFADSAQLSLAGFFWSPVNLFPLSLGIELLHESICLPALCDKG